MMQGEIWRAVPSLPEVLVSSEGRVMVAPYQAPMPKGGTRFYGGQPHFGVAPAFIQYCKARTGEDNPWIKGRLAASKVTR